MYYVIFDFMIYRDLLNEIFNYVKCNNLELNEMWDNMIDYDNMYFKMNFNIGLGSYEEWDNCRYFGLNLDEIMDLKIGSCYNFWRIEDLS